MSHTVEQAIERLRQMPADRQEHFAELLLHEIEEDERWQHSTQTHAEKLAGLVSEVLQADRRGECETLEPDQL